MMDQPHALGGAALMDSLLQSIEDEAGVSRPADPPTDDASRVGIDEALLHNGRAGGLA